MTSTQSLSLTEQARQGSPRAISQLLNSALQPKGITVKVTRDGSRLTIFAEAVETPNQSSLVGIIRRGVRDLEIDLIDVIRIYGRRANHSSTDWSDEILLKVGRTSTAGAKSSQAATDSGAILQAKFSNLVDAIRKIHIGKRTAIGLSGFVLLVLISLAGVTGFHAWQVHANRADVINKVQATLKETSDPTKAASIDDLNSSIGKLKQAGLLLQSIPSSAGSSYQQAQAELEKVRIQISALEKRIEVEQNAASIIVTADRSAQSAINTFKSSVNLAEWKASSKSLQEAISQLESIPTDSFVAEQVKAKLATYRNEAAVITKTIGTENQALQALEVVDNAARQAMDITDGKYEYSIADLRSAQAAWQRAIKLLKTVPAKTMAAAAIEQRRSVYTENLGKITDGIKKLNNCLRHNLTKEVCGYFLLNLTQPPSSQFSTDSTSGSDPFQPKEF